MSKSVPVVDRRPLEADHQTEASPVARHLNRKREPGDDVVETPVKVAGLLLHELGVEGGLGDLAEEGEPSQDARQRRHEGAAVLDIAHRLETIHEICPATDGRKRQAAAQ